MAVNDDDIQGEGQGDARESQTRRKSGIQLRSVRQGLRRHRYQIKYGPVENVDPVVKEYAQAAKDYDEKWAFYVEATTRETLKRLPMPEGGHVLDVGCGTGELLSRIARQYPQAVLAGIDPVPEMLAGSEKKTSERVGFGVGYANALSLADAS